jgi:hypothetical protein
MGNKKYKNKIKSLRDFIEDQSYKIEQQADHIKELEMQINQLKAENLRLRDKQFEEKALSLLNWYPYRQGAKDWLREQPSETAKYFKQLTVWGVYKPLNFSKHCENMGFKDFQELVEALDVERALDILYHEAAKYIPKNRLNLFLKEIDNKVFSYIDGFSFFNPKQLDCFYRAQAAYFAHHYKTND